MKVYIGPYKSWVGPYQLVDLLFFWQSKYPSDELSKRWDYKLNSQLSNWLAGTWVNTFCEKVSELRGDRKMKIHIDGYDVWSMDSTLAPIILPMLKKLKETKHGSCQVDMNDVPEYMRTVNTEDYDSQSVFDFYRVDNEDTLSYNVHDRWDWVLNEMIWAFEQLQPDNDWEAQYWIQRPELDLKDYPEDEGKSAIPVRWTTEGKCDWEGRQKHNERVDKGLALFGKYFRGLWD